MTMTDFSISFFPTHAEKILSTLILMPFFKSFWNTWSTFFFWWNWYDYDSIKEMHLSDGCIQFWKNPFYYLTFKFSSGTTFLCKCSHNILNRMKYACTVGELKSYYSWGAQIL